MAGDESIPTPPGGDSNPLAELKRLLPLCLLSDQLRLGSRLALLLRQGGGTTTAAAEINQLLARARRSAEQCALRAARRPAVTYPEALPVSARRQEILELLRHHSVLVIAGETGSGKTTQIPKMCLEAGFGVRARIGCTQPRRVAAVSVSRRVAEELGVGWGREVGCKIRFNDETSPDTCIKFMTDGMLLAEVQGDPNLAEYEVVVVDEAHERSLNIDFLIGHLRGLVTRRRDLKVIITSATIDTARFSAAFNNAPVVEVSGRVFPVEVRYAPLDDLAEESGDQTYVDAAATAVEDVITGTPSGDLLVFLPGERDIRELRDLLATRGVRDVDMIPLFGRLSSAEQQRVFAPSAQRKVVLATNIAETSITLPGIRYVIDTGLARISRYNPRTRTRRLPVEPISRSSADQRKGRSGRVAHGVCIRLYSEEDFLGRGQFTQPEIQRANLAEVILRMKAAELGDIETFPFLEPPGPAAIRAGYDLLRELGALDDHRVLTDVGRALSRLPVDPTIGRIILQSHKEGVLDEVLVIAAGLSIQDPRDRPFEEAAAASTAHRKFQHPASDFLTLLNLWNAFHDQWERLKTQGQLRKFCKANYLSYLRMREWVEIHAQLWSAFHDTVGIDPTDDVDEAAAESAAGSGPPGSLSPEDRRFQAIHRAILAGLLGHVARREERNQYRATGNRQVAVFPGSCLHEKGGGPPPAQGRGAVSRGPKPPAAASRQPEWVVAGEIVETSRLFARTLAGVDPAWIAELGAHLCKVSHDQARWDLGAGQVTARERVTFHGLEVAQRRVAYGPIAPQEATDLFVRAALVEEDLIEGEGAEGDEAGASRDGGRARPGRRRWQLVSTRFLEVNRAVRHRIATWQTRTRHHGVADLDERLFRFYGERLSGVSGVADLNRVLRERLSQEPDFLCATEKDLVGDLELTFDAAAFPDVVAHAGQSVGITYAYAPGEEHDGATLRVPLGAFHSLQQAPLLWSVPGLRQEQIAWLLRELPRALRRDLQPFAPKVAEIVREFEPRGNDFLDELAAFVSRRYGVAIPKGTWTVEGLPNHLRPRFEVIGPDQKPVASGRDLAGIEKQVTSIKTPAVEEAWTRTALQWERFGLSSWSIGDVPARIEVGGGTGWSMAAYPGLQAEDGEVSLRLFRRASEARRHTAEGWALLLSKVLQKELAWLQKDLKALERHRILYATLGTGEELLQTALVHLKQSLFPSPESLDARSFDAAVARAREQMRGMVPPFVDLVGEVLRLRQELLMARTPYAGMAQEIQALLPPRFLQQIPRERLSHVPRYLKAMGIRAQRAALNPRRDTERATLIAPFQTVLAKLASSAGVEAKNVEVFRWALEEYKVSVFAQELGTAEPISPKRLQVLAETSMTPLSDGDALGNRGQGKPG